ncbi:GTP 3',8-cyclase [Gammaproteobacteria bacterium]
MSLPLADRFGRRVAYLRLSITDACDFSCGYCLPNGYRKCSGSESFLSPLEIELLVRAFADLGLWKVRLTGGEPMVRRDILEIARRISGVPGIRRLAISTNGHRLKPLARDLRAAGVDAINVSVDSLNRQRFAAITGRDRFDDVMAGIEESLAVGFPSIKLNAVLLRGENEIEFDDYLEFVRYRPVSVRFIELMPTAGNPGYFEKFHVRSTVLSEKLLANGWSWVERGEADGPAMEFAHADYQGRIGLIAPYSRDFCSRCNRLRVSSHGALQLCLFGGKQYPLRRYLADDARTVELRQTIQSLLGKKDVSHHLLGDAPGSMRTFSAIGG